MRAICTLIALTLLGGVAPGDFFFESFEDTVFPPPGWVIYNADGGDECWQRLTHHLHSGNACVACFDETDRDNDDWLVTPALIPLGNDTFFDWWYRGQSIGHRESLETWVSTTTQDLDSFHTRISAHGINTNHYEPETVSVAQWTGQRIFLGLRYVQVPGQLNVYLDDFSAPNRFLHDVGVTAIDVPADSEPPGVPIYPTVEVHNWGDSAQTGIPVHIVIRDTVTGATVFTDSTGTSRIQPAHDRTVNFPDSWTPTPGIYWVESWTDLPGDLRPENDTCARKLVRVPFHDVGVTWILAPTGIVSIGAVVAPRAVVHNYGSFTESFPVTFRIGSVYNETVSGVTLEAGDTDTVSFPTWNADQVGDFATLAFTLLAYDQNRANDSAAGQVVVISPDNDVGATAILEPAGNRGLDSVLTPRVVVHNYGLLAETFPLTLRIGGAYEQTMGSVTLLSGQTDTVEFPSWTAQPTGTHATTAFTFLAGDGNPSNDTVTGQVVVMPPLHDVGATRIILPGFKATYEEDIFPVVRVENFGTFGETFNVEVLIRDEMLSVVFEEQEQVAALAPGEVRDFAFTAHSWTAEPVGDYAVIATTTLPGDAEPGNDECGPRTFKVLDVPPGPPGWTEMESMPSGPSGRAVKRGGWMVRMGNRLYAAKGYKTQEFYSYDPFANDWTELGPLPHGDRSGRRRPAKKGSRGVSDDGDHIYYTAGNNTLSFFKYHPLEDTWLRLPDVPEGPRGKRVKGGNDLAFIMLDDTGWVYLMKGYKTEFYRYNTVTDEWDTLPDVPYGRRSKYKRGSWLVYDGEGHLYAHQANYYNRTTNDHYMFKYDVRGDSWYSEPLGGMPLCGLHGGRVRKKKSKDGGSAAWYDGCIYALKGGNTQQFWKCAVEADSWTELDTVPTLGTSGRKRRVKYGAKLVHWSAGVFYTMKGNKTRELWRFKSGVSMGPSPERRGAVMSGRTGRVPAALSVYPSPLADRFATVRYSLPRSGPAVLTVCDVVGRVVTRQSVTAGRAGVVSLDLGALASGIYLIRLESPDATETRQLVVR
jgi:hypothetical protein